MPETEPFGLRHAISPSRGPGPTARADGAEPLDRLRSAVEVQLEVTALGDELLDHYVAAARAEGCSWADVGGVLGVTRQAAQQRHTGWLGRLVGGARRGSRGMFTRFDPAARQSVVQAQVAARALGDDFVGTEHLLLGVLADEESPGARALAACGVERASIESELREHPELRSQRSSGRPGRHLRFTPGAKEVLEQALRQALSLAHRHIGTEHLVLALHETGDTASGLLARRGVTYPRLRVWVAEHAVRDTGD